MLALIASLKVIDAVITIPIAIMGFIFIPDSPVRSSLLLVCHRS